MNIKEVSQITGVSANTIRYYEKIGLIMPIVRVNGIRKFKERNINQINFVRQMRNAGLGIKILKDYVSLVFEAEPQTVSERKAILGKAFENLNTKIEEIIKARDYLRWKIDNYDSHMIKAEDELK
jgi:DNA-binding transcriptional MerR regulator